MQTKDSIKFRLGVFVAVAVIFVLATFALVWGFYSDGLQHLGIRPRSLKGILGIFTAPIVHGDLNHLLSNAFPILMAIPALFYFFYHRAVAVLITTYLLSGFWVWISARDAIHLGASGVVYGLISFLFFASIFKKNRSGLALAAVIIFLYGAQLVVGFFPSPGISFEAHISGAVAGLFIAGFLQFYDYKKPENEENLSSTVNSSSSEEVTFKYFYKSSDDSKKK